MIGYIYGRGRFVRPKSAPVEPDSRGIVILGAAMSATPDDRTGRLDRLDQQIAEKSRLWMRAMFAGHGDEEEYLVREVADLKDIRRLLAETLIQPEAQ